MLPLSPITVSTNKFISVFVESIQEDEFSNQTTGGINVENYVVFQHSLINRIPERSGPFIICPPFSSPTPTRPKANSSKTQCQHRRSEENPEVFSAKREADGKQCQHYGTVQDSKRRQQFPYQFQTVIHDVNTETDEKQQQRAVSYFSLLSSPNVPLQIVLSQQQKHASSIFATLGSPHVKRKDTQIDRDLHLIPIRWN
uniref:Uncharacterized protein n=1 Tax=Solanum tuberosum TaxID=4113 RepID=M1DCY6_SOLTU